ncbi:MAG: hypothetical protein UR28_C0010G0045 [Candidatus Peregrinibacteria bacterium GW2011_GWF2_33_10]|nr:MAG: hypothetical protein UR28_C0010G0045 [Candidatus Peregrinibacteria bacterium GW2011_GWF2_33_10]OGJ46107.1 MAG: hypothetical protein A2272_05270 [Candidatus Peregrinibacteria bacterium RIFOXYA12_FULL_33_12]OGJ46188.1 MAG: hypothetical protein A2263_04855 [Candidatus Peregrinibacteria bacterium RIFOXYA2_FULL_33_21]OGJ51604.1 MAG: hypothetical protein A2307_04025 [Candidatus Peregrinibacteria bacterium RIFOXYB2_FULL_33_20]
MSPIDLLLETKDLENLYTSIKLFQHIKQNGEILEFLENQIRRQITDEKCAELDDEIENIFNKLNFKSKKEAKEIGGNPVYEFDIAEIKAKLKTAIQNRKDVEIEYYSGSLQTFKKLRIRPDQISGTMLDAFDYKKGENVVFKLNRIKNITFTISLF